ncbi:MAG: signal peptidase II [Pseudomonadales bacterium]|jgi:signal peptidase II
MTAGGGAAAGARADLGWTRWLGVAVIAVGLDQLSKWYVAATLPEGARVDVLPVFSWVRWHNDGAAFSMLAGSGGWQRWFFVGLAVCFALFIIYELRRLSPADRLMGLVYGLILGGAVGNAVDRLVHGYVVDFILVHYRQWYFPAFNVADMCLSIGAALWILALASVFLRERRSGRPSGESAGESK